MLLTSINVSQPKPLQIGRRRTLSGIFKEPVSGPIQVSQYGLEGDVQVNRKYHGGSDQAVYLYAWDDYLWWQGELKRELAPGRFGENLTVDSFGQEPLRIGDRFHINEETSCALGPAVVLEITAPRIPCATLAASLEISTLVKQFKLADRPGCYARVLQTGTLQAGMAVSHESRGGASLLESYHLINNPKADLATLKALLRSPLAHRIRSAFENRLA